MIRQSLHAHVNFHLQTSVTTTRSHAHTVCELIGGAWVFCSAAWQNAAKRRRILLRQRMIGQSPLAHVIFLCENSQIDRGNPHSARFAPAVNLVPFPVRK